jgi:hypothetical protein
MKGIKKHLSKKQNEDELKTMKERMTNIKNLLVVIQPFLQNIKPEMLGRLQITKNNEQISYDIRHIGDSSAVF